MPNDPKNPTPQQLQAALILSWGADTSHKFGDWVHTVPSLGQDVVTALVVQDFYGGTIWRAPLPCYLRSHHWNVDTRYATLDFTGGHLVYMDGLPEYGKGEECIRKALLENPDVQRRYQILSARVGVWLRWLCKDDYDKPERELVKVRAQLLNLSRLLGKMTEAMIEHRDYAQDLRHQLDVALGKESA